MKISQKRLKQIIKEELQQTTPQESKPIESKSKLGDFFIDLGKKIRSSGVKGIDQTEIQALASLVKDLIELTNNKSATPALAALEKKIEKIKGSN
jgi:hypothetical protein